MSKRLLAGVLVATVVTIIFLLFLITSTQKPQELLPLNTPPPSLPPLSNNNYSLSTDGSTLLIAAQISNITAREDKTFLEIKFNNFAHTILALEKNDPFGLLLTNNLQQTNSLNRVVQPIFVTKAAQLDKLKDKRAILTFLLSGDSAS